MNPETIMRCATNRHYVRALRALIEMLKFYGEIPAPLAAEILERLRWRRNDCVGEDEVPASKVLESTAFPEERAPTIPAPVQGYAILGRYSTRAALGTSTL